MNFSESKGSIFYYFTFFSMSMIMIMTLTMNMIMIMTMTKYHIIIMRPPELLGAP